MLLSVQNLQKTYGALIILDAISFVINTGERIGIVGTNGVGKSTLLRILTGQEEADSGSIVAGTNVEIGYLPQSTPPFHGSSINDLIMESLGNLRQLEEQMHLLERKMSTASEEELSELLTQYQDVSTQFLDRGGYELDYKIDTIFTGLGISYLPRTQAVDTLSGGEKARVGLATLLLRSPDLLLLDEPTNHLDFASMEWLESFFKDYHGAIVMVSHDRHFLNKTVTGIFEIDEYSHQLKSYTGNYDDYKNTKKQQLIQWQLDYERQQEEIKDLRKRIKTTGRQIGHASRPARDNDKFARYFFEQNRQSAISSNIRAAQVQLERIEADPIQKPPQELRINSYIKATPISSHIVIQLQGVHKTFAERVVLKDIDLVLHPQSRLLLTGPNGAGKTTLLKLLLGLIEPDAGTIMRAPGLRAGYLSQEPGLQQLDLSVIDTYRSGQEGFEGEMVARLLGYGLFRLEDMQKKVRQLSVGQRRKLELACLMAAGPNMLLLDEPTNYISLDVLEGLEDALQKFPGPIIAISHDRHFIDRFQGEVWEMSEGILSRKKETDPIRIETEIL